MYRTANLESLHFCWYDGASQPPDCLLVPPVARDVDSVQQQRPLCFSRRRRIDAELNILRIGICILQLKDTYVLSNSWLGKEYTQRELFSRTN